MGSFFEISARLLLLACCSCASVQPATGGGRCADAADPVQSANPVPPSSAEAQAPTPPETHASGDGLPAASASVQAHSHDHSHGGTADHSHGDTADHSHGGTADHSHGGTADHSHGGTADHSHGKPVKPEDAAPSAISEPARVTSHTGLQEFSNNGNTLRGLATPSSGAQSYEVWRSSVAVGSATPPHRHESEEVFIFLRGKGRAKIGDKELNFDAPATVVAPAGVLHQFINTGDVPTDAIVVVGIGSRIFNAEGKEMQLPWRR